MPSTYEKLGVHFLFPDNWTLDEEESVEGVNSITVQSPGGAFWSIALHEPDINPDVLAATALEALQLEYRDSEYEEVSENIGGQTVNGYDLSFFYLDFTSTALIRAFRTPKASCLLLCQAEDRELVALAPVFRAITTSLLANV